MNRRVFGDLVRQYGMWAQRNRRSYADVIDTLRAAYHEWVMQQEIDEETRTRHLDYGDAVLLRDYGRYDSSWSLPAEG